MKQISILFITLFIISACGSNTNDSKKDETDKKTEAEIYEEFHTNFDIIKYPTKIDKNSYNEKSMKLIEYEHLKLLIKDIKNSEDEYNTGKNNYYYFGKIEMPFIYTDIFIVFNVSEKATSKESTFTKQYQMYLMDKSGEITGKKIIAEAKKQTLNTSYSECLIHNPTGFDDAVPTIERTNWLKTYNTIKENKLSNDFYKGKIVKYIISSEGEIIEEKFNLENEKKINELLSNVKQVSLPYTYNEFKKQKSYEIDLSYHKYLKQGGYFSSKKSKGLAIVKLPKKDDINLLIVHTWTENLDMSDSWLLFSLSKYGEILDAITIAGGSLDYVETNFTENHEIRILTIHGDESSPKKPPTFDETIYKIKSSGKFSKQGTMAYFDKLIKDLSIDKPEKALLVEAQKQFYKIKTSRDIANYIDEYQDQLQTIIQNGIDNIKPIVENPDLFYYINKVIPCVKVGYAAEASGIEVTFNYYDLYKKAKYTPQKDDNLFFEAYSYGNEIWLGNFGQKYLHKILTTKCSSFETCYSMLGSGNCYNALLKTEMALKSKTNFTNQLNQLKQYIINSFELSSKFGYSKQKTLEYIEKINTEISLNEKQKYIIQKIKKEVKTYPNSNYNYINK